MWSAMTIINPKYFAPPSVNPGTIVDGETCNISAFLIKRHVHSVFVCQILRIFLASHVSILLNSANASCKTARESDFRIRDTRSGFADLLYLAFLFERGEIARDCGAPDVAVASGEFVWLSSGGIARFYAHSGHCFVKDGLFEGCEPGGMEVSDCPQFTVPIQLIFMLD
jgi:hypothetical protein